MATGKKAGASLVETLLVCAVFTVLVLITFGVIRYCTKSIAPIEDRANVQMQLRRVQFNMSEELRRTSWKSIVIGAGSEPYMHFICFKSAMSLANPNFFTVSDIGTPVWTKYVLYYIFRPTADALTSTQACGCATPSDPDNVCPHKGLLRVDIDISLNVNENDQSAAVTALRHYLKSIPATAQDLRSTYTSKVYQDPGNGPYYAGKVLNCFYIARDLLSFNLAKTKSDSESNIRIDVRSYKIKEASSSIQIGQSDLTRTPFVIQSEARIMPQNQ
jgi:hypothetical protein